MTHSNDLYGDSSDSYSTKACSALKPPRNLSNLFNEFRYLFSQQNKDDKNIVRRNYSDSDDNLNNKDALSLFHINACSFPKILKNLNISMTKRKLILM